jgi:hypothetical protein
MLKKVNAKDKFASHLSDRSKTQNPAAIMSCNNREEDDEPMAPHIGQADIAMIFIPIFYSVCQYYKICYYNIRRRKRYANYRYFISKQFQQNKRGIYDTQYHSLVVRWYYQFFPVFTMSKMVICLMYIIWKKFLLPSFTPSHYTTHTILHFRYTRILPIRPMYTTHTTQKKLVVQS